MATKTYTVVGIYEDNRQRYAEFVEAESPEDAEEQVHQCIEVPIAIAAVIEGKVNVLR